MNSALPYVSSIAGRISDRLLRAFALAGAFLVLAPPLAHSGGAVTNCSNLANLMAAMNGGGVVTFACNGTFALTNTITIAADTTLDSSTNTTTLSASNRFRLFNVNPGVTLTLLHMTLADGV